MLLNLFNEMRAAKVPVSVRELLDLINALKHNVVFADMDEFYFLSRTILVRTSAISTSSTGPSAPTSRAWKPQPAHRGVDPEEWLRKEFERMLTDEERAQIQSSVAWTSSSKSSRSAWKNRRNATPAATSGSARWHAKVGPARARTSTTRWSWAPASRSPCAACASSPGRQDELDLDGTIDHTARDAGLLNIQMRPERRNSVKPCCWTSAAPWTPT